MQTLEALTAAREKILSAAAALPFEKQDQVFLGIWGMKDLLAHLIGWDYANLEAAQAVLAERLPAFYAHYDKDWRKYNALLVGKYRKDNWGEQILLVKNSRQDLLSHLSTVSAPDFVRYTGVRFHGWRVTIERLLRAETSDEEKHYEQIAAFVAVPLL